MIVEQLSMRIAKKIKELDPDGEESVEVLYYELGIQLNYGATLFVTAVLGWATGALFYALVSFFAFVLIRKVSGGFHMESLTACALISGLIFSIIPQIDLAPYMIYILTAVSSIIYIRYAPNYMTESIPTTNPMLCRACAVSLCLANVLVASPVIALTFFTQAILILPYWKGVNSHGHEANVSTETV